MTKAQVVTALTDMRKALDLLLSEISSSEGELSGEAPAIPFDPPTSPTQGQYPMQQACPKCGETVWAQWSQKKSKVYFTNTQQKTDFHNHF